TKPQIRNMVNTAPALLLLIEDFPFASRFRFRTLTINCFSEPMMGVRLGINALPGAPSTPSSVRGVNMPTRAVFAGAFLGRTKVVSPKLNSRTTLLHALGASPQVLTTRSISTRAPSGSADTPITVRAGKGGLKYVA